MIKWFQNIPDKQNAKFVKFDVVDFYPSITKELLEKALDLAANHVDIPQQDREIILSSNNTLLYSENQAWVKKSSQYDVTMGSWNGAEVCELVGIFILFELKNLNMAIGLYRDDGLGVAHCNPQEIERMKKQICTIFESHK